MAKDAYRYFRVEARELLEQLARGALDLEKGPDSADLVQRLLRLAHTLKGAARVVKQVAIADLIHGVEDTLAPYRNADEKLPRERIDTVLQALDAISGKLAELPVPQNTEVTIPIPETVRMVRADVVEVDVLLEGLGEIGSELSAMRKSTASIKDVRDLAGKLLENSAQLDTKIITIADKMNELIDTVAGNMAASIELVDRELRQARDAAEKLRLIPVSSIFNTLERTARDVAHSVGKQVIFEATGGDVRIDGEVLDGVQSALVQLVRNAVAHGIETVAERQSVAKDLSGRVTLTVIRRGYRVCFRCTDDGCGVDLDAVKRAMLRQGSRPADIQGLDAAQLLALLLQGGVSTAKDVTEMAGRGIGLDVVRETAQRLNGKVFAETSPGLGTMIELGVPLSMASLEVLLIDADQQLAAIPIDNVLCTLRIAADNIVHTPEGEVILFEGQLIPLVRLKLTKHHKPARMNAMTVVIVSTGKDTMAIGISSLHGIETIILRPLPALAPADPIVLGMHLDSEGNPRIVLNPEQFYKLEQQVNKVADKEQAQFPILIIDDSLTTRMLESSILESAGFVVEMASSAEEGMDMAKNKQYALFLVDVEMPGMDGFEFVKRTRADPVLHAVPCILVTSRDSHDDRQRGLNAGASAYIVKGEFDQVKFLQRVTHLVL